MNVLFVASA